MQFSRSVDNRPIPLLRRIALLAALFITTSTAAPTATEDDAEKAPTATPQEFQPDTKVVYKTVGDAELRLHVFRPGSTPSKAPAIVFFFGGGFLKGDPSQFYGQSHHFAMRGMVAISAEYRTKTSHGTDSAACARDAKSAMRWVRAHAEELGIDPHRIAAGGGSAGGFLAAATATIPGYDEPGEDSSVSCRPDALVIFNGPFDARPDGSGFEKALLKRGPDFLPINHITAPFPPTILLLGDRDHIIPPESARNTKAVIEKIGGRCDLHLYEGQAHSFFNARKSGGKYYHLTLQEVDQFFASLGWIPNASAQAR